MRGRIRKNYSCKSDINEDGILTSAWVFIHNPDNMLIYKKKIKAIIYNYYERDIYFIPNVVGELTNIEVIELANHTISYIPASIGKLTKLKKLDLSFNNIGSIPEEIKHLVNLKELDLTRNKIKCIPTGIMENLVNLSELYLSFCDFDKFPIEIFKAKSIKMLSIIESRSTSKITEIPQQINQLVNLTSLRLDGNNITRIPDEIGELNDLKKLSLNENRLIYITPKIAKLQNLEDLQLMHNNISELPDEIVQLVKLKTLLLRNNKLTSLPIGMYLLVNLQVLDLSGSNDIPPLYPDLVLLYSSL